MKKNVKQTNTSRNSSLKESTTNQKQPVNKKTKNDSQYHQSSREAYPVSEQTQKIGSEMQIQIHEQKFEMIQQKQQKRMQEVCYQMIMISPYDTTYFTSFKKRTKELLENYTKNGVIKLIMQNAKYERVNNFNNLNKIDDEKFWNSTVPMMLQYVIDEKKQKNISSNVRMLTPNRSQILEVSKAQILITLINMFFCIMPKQTNRKSSLNFTQLMSVDQHSPQNTITIKFQKLKFFVQYFKKIIPRNYKQLQHQKIQIQRSSTQISQNQYRNIQYQLRQVQIINGYIQDKYKYDIMIDFANKNIGGGVLGRGCVQEEILFCIFPELLFTMCVSFQMNEKEATVIYGAERFSNYMGYSDSFKFKDSFNQKDNDIGPFQSVIIAVDAYQFRTTQQKQHNQYQPYLINRQIKKFLCGIQTSDYSADQNMRVCTGKWGCGAFGGDIYLKFLIQWIACSIANKNMVFMCHNQEERRQLQIMVRFLCKFDSLELLEIIEEYNHYGESKNRAMTFFQFVKKYCC